MQHSQASHSSSSFTDQGRRPAQAAEGVRRCRRLVSPSPCAQGLSLEQSVSQFSHTMTAQADLRVEAAHLRRFLHNFKSLSESITAPEPVAPWVRLKAS